MNRSASLPPAPARQLSTWLLLGCLVALVVASFATLPLQFGALFGAEAWSSTREFLAGFAPPETATPFLIKTGYATLETLSMSALGTLLAVVAGLALAVPAAGKFGAVPRALVRALLNGLRAVPELVWASLMLVAAGLGPFGGTLALAFHTSGVLGRLFADALENVEPLPQHTLLTNGAPRLPAFFYATLQQTLPQMLSYTLYRWENNIRAAAVLGVVGAGGLGQMLKYHLSLFQMPDAATVIIAMLALVALVDALSYLLRRALTR